MSAFAFMLCLFPAPSAHPSRPSPCGRQHHRHRGRALAQRLAHDQARVAANATVVSTSTRNFPNWLGQGVNVFLSSPELAAIAALLGKLPSVEEYMGYASKIDSMAPEIYRYLNFDRMPDFTAAAEQGKRIAVELKVA
jgi:hypothetical protein